MSKQAKALLGTGLAGLLVGVIFLPSTCVRGSRYRPTFRCRSYLEDTARIAFIYAHWEGKGFYPWDPEGGVGAFQTIADWLGEDFRPRLFICPYSKEEVPAEPDASGRYVITEANTSYAWTRKRLKTTDPPTAVLAYDKHPHYDGRRSVAFVQQHVLLLSEEDFAKALEGRLDPARWEQERMRQRLLLDLALLAGPPLVSGLVAGMVIILRRRSRLKKTRRCLLNLREISAAWKNVVTPRHAGALPPEPGVGTFQVLADSLGEAFRPGLLICPHSRDLPARQDESGRPLITEENSSYLCTSVGGGNGHPGNLFLVHDKRPHPDGGRCVAVLGGKAGLLTEKGFARAVQGDVTAIEGLGGVRTEGILSPFSPILAWGVGIAVATALALFLDILAVLSARPRY